MNGSDKLQLWAFVSGFLLATSSQPRVVTRVRVCNYVKIKTGRIFSPVLKIVTQTAQAA